MEVIFTYDPTSKTTLVVDNTVYADRDAVIVKVYSNNTFIGVVDSITNEAIIQHSYDGVYAIQLKVIDALTGVELDSTEIHYQLVMDYSEDFLRSYLIKLLDEGCPKLTTDYMEIKKRIRAVDAYYYAQLLPEIERTINEINHAIYHLSSNQSYQPHPSGYRS